MIIMNFIYIGRQLLPTLIIYIVVKGTDRYYPHTYKSRNFNGTLAGLLMRSYSEVRIN